MINPKISIIIPNYNHGKFLEKRIDTVLTQTYQNFEVIILDDCSTDNSLTIIGKYKNHPKVSKIIINSKNSGNTFRQWMNGIRYAHGEYIWIAESDDYSSLSFLKKLITIIESDTNISLVFSQSVDVDENENYLNSRISYTKSFSSNIFTNNFIVEGNKIIDEYFYLKNIIPNASAVIFRKNSLANNNLEEELTKFNMIGDWFFWINIIKNKKIAFVSENLNYFRQHSLTTRVHDKMSKRLNRIKEEKYLIDKMFYNSISKNILKNRLLDSWINMVPKKSKISYKELYQVCHTLNISLLFVLYKILQTIIMKK